MFDYNKNYNQGATDDYWVAYIYLQQLITYTICILQCTHVLTIIHLWIYLLFSFFVLRCCFSAGAHIEELYPQIHTFPTSKLSHWTFALIEHCSQSDPPLISFILGPCASQQDFLPDPLRWGCPLWYFRPAWSTELYVIGPHKTMWC